MHFVFLTIPSSGEFNVQLASAKELINANHRVTFLSGSSFYKHVQRFKDGHSEKKRHLIGYQSLGSQRSVEDFTPTVQDRINEMRKAPGDLSSFCTCIEIAMVSREEHMMTADIVSEAIEDLNPDLVVVDVLSPAMITGVRLTKRPFALTIPCSPGMTALPTYFAPHCMAGNRDGSWTTLLENIYLKTKELYYFTSRHDMREKRAYLTTDLKLKSFGRSHDTALLPPYWEDPNCVGGIHFNTFGLTDCIAQPSSVVFVGPGVSEQPTSAQHSEEISWLDATVAAGERVVYVNMGSMFVWTAEQLSACIEALRDVHDLTGSKTRFLLKVNRPVGPDNDFTSLAQLPAYIKLTHWIECQQSVYRHPAVKVFVHHGGGNSFNEAVYFGLPQLVLSQWLDTHEYASLAQRFGLGLQSSSPPHLQTIDIREKLLRLLGPEWSKFKANANLWSIRSKLGGGPAAAARLLEVHAENAKGQNVRQRREPRLCGPLIGSKLLPLSA
ncbi:unnamed protein product [Parajaminaea phylloscopi]